jgi:hypothetical protein
MAAYAALLVILALHHEMWRDEVRAFSVATRAGSWSALLAELHYEGHPALWYVILRVGFALTHSNLVLPIAGLAVALCAAYVILRYAPFPIWLRLLAIFGAFLGYELSVVSRNYGIGVLFMLLACVAYKARRDQPLILGAMLALAANTSVHAAVASLLLVALWLTDLLDSDTRPALVRPSGIASVALALLGVVLALVTARPSPDMAWAFSASHLDAGRVIRSMLTDPGKGLVGYHSASISAAAELPWRVLNIDGGVATRIIVDACLAWLAWSLRGSWRALAAIVITIVGFEVLFRNVYTGALRHEGIVLFLIFSICWMAVVRAKDPSKLAKRVAFGLLPLFAFQSAALPVMAVRYIRYPESNSKAFGEWINANPEYRNAILVAEPDYMMESMPYYVSNPVYMARQGEFHFRVYFDSGPKRKLELTLDRLVAISDSLACAKRVPVLMSIAYPDFTFRQQGDARPNYKGSRFTWDSSSRAALYSRQPDQRPVASFPSATSDEFYRIYLIRCRTADYGLRTLRAQDQQQSTIED